MGYQHKDDEMFEDDHCMPQSGPSVHVPETPDTAECGNGASNMKSVVTTNVRDRLSFHSDDGDIALSKRQLVFEHNCNNR
mmetsp:Transcript_2689/g.4395  ORF Transcript_2689/g.4395 Transcript_2689/m.4395 type:complete len:80 (+) Transcript_2689:256-495(+)